jgi:hypothetical protein
MNAERAARRAPVSGHKNFFWPTIPIKKKQKKNKSPSFLSQCGISYDHKAKNFKMKKQKATSSQAPKRVGPPNKVKGSKQG